MISMSPNSIKISPSVRLDQCEVFIEELASENDRALELPTKLAGQGVLGLEASLIHLIVTWARVAKTATLVIPASGHQAKSYLQDLCLTAYGLTALSWAKNVIDHDGSLIPSQDVKKLVTTRLREFDDPNKRIFAPDEGVSFLSVYGGQYEFGRWMFTASSTNASPILQSPQQLGNLLSQRIEQIIPSKFAERFDEKRLENLGLVAFELLENAYQHGRLDENADPIKVGVRGISLRIIDIDFDTSSVAAGRNKDINLYLMKRMLRNKEKENLFFEMTVFDSGIGYSRWINAPCNESDAIREHRGKSEKETILHCLLHHATSKANVGSGVGLIRVIRLLKSMFGFIRIRTGQSCYYARLDLTLDGRRRMLGGDYDEASNPDIKLEEWFPQKLLAESSGTSVTFCIPLTNWKKAADNG